MLAVSQQLNVLLVGPRRTGKSSTGNTLLGRGQVFETRGGASSAAASGTVARRRLNVVDAQGWGSSEEFVPSEEKRELLRALSLFGLGGPHVVLLVLPLLDFTQSEWRALQRRMDILTSTVWRHTMVLFTCGERLKKRGCSVEEHIQSGGPALRLLIDKCRHRYHVFDNKAAATQRPDTGAQEKQRVAPWKNRSVKNIGKRRGVGGVGGGEGRASPAGEQQQVRELLVKVENMLEENGGWHYSLHMYQRMEEEWCRRKLELKEQVERERSDSDESSEGGEQETRPRPAEGSEGEESDRSSDASGQESEEGNLWDDFGGRTIELKRLSSFGMKERKTSSRMIALCPPDGGQRSAFSPIRGLA